MYKKKINGEELDRDAIEKQNINDSRPLRPSPHLFDRLSIIKRRVTKILFDFQFNRFFVKN
jgi:hypothetical protein